MENLSQEITRRWSSAKAASYKDETLLSNKTEDRAENSYGGVEDMPAPISEKKSRIPSPQWLSCVTEQEKQFLDLQRKQQEEENEEKILRCQNLLEHIQNDVAIGNYTEAITAIDGEDIDFVGSSDDNATFISDIIFYKLVALTDGDFLGHEFNSKEQHSCILNTLKLSNVSFFVQL